MGKWTEIAETTHRCIEKRKYNKRFQKLNNESDINDYEAKKRQKAINIKNDKKVRR